MYTHTAEKKSFLRKFLLYVAAGMLLCVLWGCEQEAAPVESSAVVTQDPVWVEKYDLAMQHADAKEFDRAIAVMTELKEAGHTDAQAEIWALQFRQGEYLLTEQEDFSAASKLFAQLEKSGYAEAGQMYQKTYYLWAKALTEAGDHIGAYEKLKQIPDYEDAAQLLEQATQAIYAEGQALYREGNYYEAEKRFLRVSTYSDAKKYITLINVRNYPPSESVIEGLLTIFYFEDASELLLSTHSLAQLFLKGAWGDSHGYYFIIDEKSYDLYLPQIPDNHYLHIENGVFSFYPDRNAEPVPMLDVTVVTPNCLSIYNRMDQKTYTLFRLDLSNSSQDKPYEI